MLENPDGRIAAWTLHIRVQQTPLARAVTKNTDFFWALFRRVLKFYSTTQAGRICSPRTMLTFVDEV